jgi:hypothetical protein
MKKVIGLAFVLFMSFSAQAQEVFKTDAASLVEMDSGVMFKIDAVKGKVVDMDLSLTDSMAFKIYLVFLKRTSDSTLAEIPQSGMNADREDFYRGVKANMPVGTDESTINATVNGVMKAMLAGSPAEKWGAYNAIMSGYGAPLLPIGEQ